MARGARLHDDTAQKSLSAGPDGGNTGSPRLYAAISVLFLLSGFTALVYQIVWVRLLTLAFGASTFAVAAVLIAFMGGMSAGSFVFGRVVDRRRDQLRLYALLEIAIALYALAIPYIIDWLSDFYVFLYQQLTLGFYATSLVRLVVSVFILLIPTAAMGATLPLLCSLVAQKTEQAPRRTAFLYGINTFGGVLGCVGAGFLLIPWLGLNETTYLAVAVNLLVGVVCLLMQRSLKPADTPLPTEPKTKTEDRATGAASGAEHQPNADLLIPAAIAVIALSGFTAMAYETLWTRVLGMIVGTTVYAFTTMLAAFLMGIVLGSWLYFLRPARRPALLLAMSQFGIGLWVLLLLPYFDDLPFVFLKMFEWSSENWSQFQLGRFVMLFLLLIVPTTLSGLSFPLAVRIVVRRAGETGRKVGFLYGFNTIGAILGAFVGGFVLIPFVGLQQGMVIAASVSIFAGLVMLAVSPQLRPSRKLALSTGGVAAALGAVLLLSPWDLCYINSGAYAYAHEYNSVGNLRAMMKAYRPLFYSEGPTATVGVVRSPRGTLALTIDGKTDASTGKHADMSTQILLSHLPALFTDKPDDALLVGLGSGVSLGSLLRYRVRHVDVVEISKAVVEASNFFREHNYNALDDPRVNLIVGDGRHHLERTDKQYDLIVSQPSNPWITGNANLFTQEYYRAIASRLKKDGVACQWIPSYHMSRRMLAIILKTFNEQFTQVSVWTSSVVGDLFLIGSMGELELDHRLLLKRLDRTRIDDDLARIGMNDPTLLAMTFKFGKQGIREFLAEFDEALPVNTDTHPIVEFESPRFLLTERVARDFDERSELTGDLAGLMNLLEFTNEKNRRAFKREARTVIAEQNGAQDGAGH